MRIILNVTSRASVSDDFPNKLFAERSDLKLYEFAGISPLLLGYAQQVEMKSCAYMHKNLWKF